MARAVASGDLASLSSVSRQSPELAATGLLQAVERQRGATLPDELTQLIAETSERLRIAGKFPAALRLAAAGQRATPAVSLEEAIAALACGRDDIVRELAAIEPSVGLALAPAIAVLSGVEPARATGLPPAARAIRSACRAAGAMQRGRAATVRTQLAAIPADLRGRLRVSELREAARIAPGKASSAISAARVLLRSSVARAQPGVQRALARDLAAIAPREFLDGTARHWGFTPEVLSDGVTIAISHDPSIQGTEARVVQLVLRAGLDAFPPEHRGTAALFLGYALSTSDPLGAQRAFDQALAQGADLIESLRGRWLLTAATLQEDTSDTPAMAQLRTQGRDAAERLSHLLARIPDGVPFIVAIARERARHNLMLGGYSIALELVQSARALMESAGIRSPIVGADLLCVEAVCRSREEPLRALELARAGRKLNPSDVQAWTLEVAMARRCERHVDADDTVLEAADRGLPGSFAAEAAGIRRKRGLPSFVPGRTSAGFLAVELARRLRALAAAPTTDRVAETVGASDLANARAALPRQQQLAYDAATILLVGRLVSANEAARRLQMLLQGVDPNAPETTWLLAATACSVEPKDLPALGRSLERCGLAPGAMVVVAEFIATNCPPRVSGAFLTVIANRLDRSQITVVRRRMDGADTSGERDAGDALREIDRWLAPELSLGDLVDGDVDVQRLGEEPIAIPASETESPGVRADGRIGFGGRHPVADRSLRARRAAEAREFLRHIRLSPDVVARLDEDSLFKFATEIEHLWQSDPDPDPFRLLEALVRLSISPADMMAAMDRGRRSGGSGGKRRRR